MKLATISEVSKTYNVSTRTLRYYEDQGLLKSTTKEDYAYRVYENTELEKLELILMLRKLTFSLKEIKGLLDSKNHKAMIQIFKDKLNDVIIESEMIFAIKKILEIFMDKLNEDGNALKTIEILRDHTVEELILNTTFIDQPLKEKKMMKKEDEKDYLSVIKNPRVIFIPPMTVAASASGVCENPEDVAGNHLRAFIEDCNLCDLKPDFRVFGFNNPNPDEFNNHGYEFYVSIPDDLEVTAPLVKKHFEGGMYVAHCIKMGDFHEWPLFGKWLEHSEEYAYENRPPEGMHGTLEEHLNAY
ncbi:MAG: effector binding domain-containing protein, partial [Clostridia bacterium]|nr:effector binding domain-containing protein [Clostridia bacterium]